MCPLRAASLITLISSRRFRPVAYVLSILLDLEKKLAAIEEQLKVPDVSEENPVVGLSLPKVEEG